MRLDVFSGSGYCVGHLSNGNGHRRSVRQLTTLSRGEGNKAPQSWYFFPSADFDATGKIKFNSGTYCLACDFFRP